MYFGTQKPAYPVFRGPFLTVLILCVMVLITQAWIESVLGGSMFMSPGPGQLWAHGRIVEVSLETWKELRVLERVSNAAFMGFIASMLVLGTLGVGQPAWYMRMNSWKWVNISLVTGALVAALVIALARAWPR